MNPLQCDCSNQWLLKWLKCNSEMIKDYDKLTCSSGQRIAGVDAYNCQPYELMILDMYAIFIYILFICAPCFIYFYVHRLIYQDDDNIDGKMYDAFIAYSREDRTWVEEKLEHVLEKDLSYKLCIGDRDFIGGMPIEHNTSNAIKKSRMTLFVLSKASNESNFCKLEFTKAKEDDSNKLVVLLLEDIPAREQKDHIKEYLNKYTYINCKDGNIPVESLKSAMPKIVIKFLVNDCNIIADQ